MAKIADIIRAEFEKYAVSNNQKPDVRYLSSTIITKYVKELANRESVFSVVDEEVLMKIYQLVLIDKDNQSGHHNYSSALLHYRKFLSLKINNK